MDFNTKLENLLKQHQEFLDSNGDIIKASVRDAALKFDEALIGLLLENDETRTQFFKSISNTTVFDYREFIDYIEDKNFLLDSYTKFSNKIGLTISNKHIKRIDDVVLTFPFKDCVLEGGQSKEEENRKEIFFNETLAKDEITKLLDKKVIANATKYYYENDEVKEATDFTFTRDEAGTIKDNLIIKGNNLLALHTLKSNFAGKVKLIYIDPPYNTGNDSFKYNDNFNHSTWLTFMKNRLEVAYSLLSSTGSIYISIDDNELGYMSLLLDEIFGNENRTDLITVKRGSVTGHKAINPGVVNISDYLIGYAKDKKLWEFNRLYKSRDRNVRYNNYILNRNKNLVDWEFCSLLDAFSKYKKIAKTKLKKELGATFEK